MRKRDGNPVNRTSVWAGVDTVHGPETHVNTNPLYQGDDTWPTRRSDYRGKGSLLLACAAWVVQLRWHSSSQ